MNTDKVKIEILGVMVPVAAVIYFFSHFSPQAAVHYVIAIALVGFSIFSLRYASLSFLILAILIDDFPKYYSEELRLSMPFISLYTLEFAGASLYLLLAVYFAVSNIVMAIFSELKMSGKTLRITSVSAEIKTILMVGSASALFGLPNILDAARIYISDLGYFVNILLGFLIIRNFRYSIDKVYLAFLLVVYAIIAKVVIVSLDAIFSSASLGLVTIAPGTDAYLVGCVILFSILALQLSKNRSLSQIFLFLAIIAFSLAYFVFTASRGRMLIGAVSFIIFFYIVGRSVIVLYSMLVVFMVIFVVPILSSEYFDYFTWKLSTFVASQDGGESSLVRVITLKNILAEQLDSIYKVIVGTGLGGHFSSVHFPFPYSLLGADAFPDDWIANDTFYKPHTSPMFLLLKTGSIGLMVIYWSIFYQNLKNIKFVKKISSSSQQNNLLLLTVLPIILPLFLVNFSSKLQLATGAFLGLSYFASRVQRGQLNLLRLDQSKF